MASKIKTSVSVVPWYNAAQFKKVYEYLFSNEITKMKWAVDTISVWETRYHPSLPTAIEATYVLTSAVIQDILWTSKASLISHTDLQGIYGSAITRFVALIVDANKKPECPVSSAAEIAKSIGIPSFIVDTRNEWCHSSKPSLCMLRLATESALKYLKNSYWVKEAARVNNYVKQPWDDEPLVQLFFDFMNFHENTLKSGKARIIRTDDKSKMDPDYAFMLKKIEKHLKMNKRIFVKVLLYDGFFIPNDKELKRAIADSEYIKFDTECALFDGDEDYDEEMRKKFEHQRETACKEANQFESNNFPEVPHYHEDLWYPVIALLNKYDAMSLFMQELLKSQGNRTIVGQKMLIAWILKIMRIHSDESKLVTSPFIKMIFRYKGLVPNWLNMLHSALNNPCKFTLIIIPLILSKCYLEVAEAHRMIGLMSLKLGLVPFENRKKHYWKLYHSSKDLKTTLEQQKNNKDREKQRKRKKPIKKNENYWEPCPDDCHKLWPIGDIVNAVKDTDGEEEVEEVIENLHENPFKMEITYHSTIVVSNKNEEDDYEDETCKMNEEPDLSKIMLQIERRETVLYKRSG